MEIAVLKQIILQQQELASINHTIEREVNVDNLKHDEVVIFSGIRRCGKSTLLQQLRNENSEKDFYLNFDDERLLYFTVDDFQKLHEIFIELFGEQNTFYFDEIQNIKSWEFFIRRLHNNGKKVYLTGSNANLLSKELGTHLTGRHIQMELFPFSFSEFLKFNEISIKEKDFYTTQGRALLKKYFEQYLTKGGFPEYIKTLNTEYLKSLYESILYKDIMVRNHILNESEIKELGYFLASNIGKTITYNSLKNIIQVKHANTIKNYLRFFEDTYIIFLINKYDFSLKKQLANPKKIYFIDTALASQISFRFTEDRGRFIENVVFLQLKRKNHQLYYHKNMYECDFLIREGLHIVKALQVSVSILNEDTYTREIKGLMEALTMYNLNEGYIITEQDDEREIIIEDKKIFVLPIWKWLLT